MAVSHVSTMILLQVAFALAVFGFIVYAYYYMEHLHFHSLRLVANVGGSSNAQHFLGQRYLNGGLMFRSELIVSIVCEIIFVCCFMLYSTGEFVFCVIIICCDLC